MSFLTNLILFSPLFFIGLLILFVLDRKDSLREGAGLSQQKPSTPEPDNEAEDSLDGALESSQSSHERVQGPEDGQLDAESDFEVIELGEQEDTFEGATEFDAEELDRGQTNEEGDATGNGDPGPAGASRRTSRTRIVGKKKAASLARRDQRRAYHEFIRTQASERARQNAALEQELEGKIFEEKRRRALIEEEIAARKEKEKKEKYEKVRLDDEKRRADWAKVKETIFGPTKRKAWKISELAEMVQRPERWIIDCLNLDGLTGYKDCSDEAGKNWHIRLITGDNYYVILTQREIDGLYAKLLSSGSKGMKYSEMAKALEELVVN